MGGPIISILIIALVVGGAVAYIVKAKRKGQKCIGCPYEKSCSGGCAHKNESKESKKTIKENGKVG